MKKKVTRLGFCLALTLAMSCDGDNSGRAVWKDVLKKCAGNELLGSRVLYFGPSNNVGPASVWRKAEDGGFRLRWKPDNYLADTGGLMNEGTLSGCLGESTRKTQISPGAVLGTLFSPVGGRISLDLNRARSVDLKVASWTWDDLIEGPFEAAVNALDSDHPVRSDLERGGKLVLTRALRATGLEAVIEFSADDGADVQASVADGSTQETGEDGLGVSLKAKWEGHTKLTLTTEGEFYIAGELSEYTPSGLRAAGETRVFAQPVRVGTGARVAREVM